MADRFILNNENAHFVIIGKGPMENEIKSFSSKLKCSKNIHFVGFRNDVPDILGELNVFLITSKTEGLGTSILDALAAKVPVVATRAGGIPEIIKDKDLLLKRFTTKPVLKYLRKYDQLIGRKLSHDIKKDEPFTKSSIS